MDTTRRASTREGLTRLARPRWHTQPCDCVTAMVDRVTAVVDRVTIIIDLCWLGRSCAAAVTAAMIACAGLCGGVKWERGIAAVVCPCAGHGWRSGRQR